MVEILAAMAGSDCERLRAGWLAQPANTSSCLAFLAIGCWLLVRARNSADQGSVLLSTAAALIAVGVGSIAYHGPQPGWAESVHTLSIMGMAFVLIAQTVRLLRGQSTKGVVAAWKAAGGWMMAGLIAYVMGRTSSPWCRPETLLQLHAVWHVLIAVGLGRMAAGYAKS